MKNNLHLIIFIFFIFTSINFVKAEAGYNLWQKYDLISDNNLLTKYKELIKESVIEGNSPTIHTARNELHLRLILLIEHLRSYL